MNREQWEAFERASREFQDLDGAARRRAAAETEGGTEARAALAQESVMRHLVDAYNRQYSRG